MTPSRTQSQIRPEPDPLPAAGELLGSAVAVGVGALLAADGSLVGVAVTLGLDETLGLGLGDETVGLRLGDELPLGPAETLVLRLGKMLDIELLALSHPATMHPMTRIAAKRTRPLVKHRMPDPSARPFSRQVAPAAPSHQ